MPWEAKNDPNQFKNYSAGASYFASDPYWEVQRTNHFKAEITGLSVHSTTGDELATPEIFSMAVESVQIPNVTINTTQLAHGNEFVNVATGPAWSGGSMSLKDAIGYDMEYALWSWFCQVLDVQNDSIMGWVYMYKHDVLLKQYSPTLEIERVWNCKGCFPTSYDAGQLSYAQMDKKMISCNLAVDKAFPDRSKGSGDPTGAMANLLGNYSGEWGTLRANEKYNSGAGDGTGTTIVPPVATA